MFVDQRWDAVQAGAREESVRQFQRKDFADAAGAVFTGGVKAAFRSPDRSVLLSIVNEVFQTQCRDADAIDTSATWPVIVTALMPYKQLASTLALRHQAEVKLKEAAAILGISPPRVFQRCEQAIRKLRHPGHLERIRSSIVGWQNLYRDGRRFEGGSGSFAK
jgi:hypothetical protein